MPDRTAAGRRGGGVLRWAERLLVIAGAAALFWCAFFLIEGSLFQSRARRSADAASAGDRAAHTPDPDGGSGPPRATIVVRGSPVATISIPRVRLSAVVLHGSDEQTLRRGPGHLENTPFPGDSGNVVIAGHRDTFFRRLRNVRLDDDILLDTPRGPVHYRVTSSRVVGSHDLSVLEAAGEDVLTLITCYPFWVLGPAPDRFVVRASRVVQSRAAQSTAGRTVRTGVERRPATASIDPARPRDRSDVMLVREAIERFRSIYNARLVTRGEVRSGGPLTFQTCTVEVAGDRAEAMCQTPATSADDGEFGPWTFVLARTGARWTIRSVESE